MKKIQDRDTTLCLNYCHYYKPGKKEELACRGYEVVARLLRGEKAIAAAGPGRDFDRARAEILVQRMCLSCDFREDGCDFMLDRHAPPCGGFVLLAQLLEAGRIIIEDI